MVLTNDIWLPTEEELTVPQEITLSTPWFKAVAHYMAFACENEAKEYMLLRSEYEDPRKTLKEGALLTACGVNFLRKLKRSCSDEVATYANCIDKSSARLFISKCRPEQYVLDKCVDEKLNIARPPVGYFSKLHVHNSEKLPPPPYKYRDYHAEAAKIMKELPEDFHLRPDYKKYRAYNETWFADA